MANLVDHNKVPIGGFFEQVAFGAYPGITRLHLTGAAFGVPKDVLCTLWCNNTIYAYPSSETAVNSMGVASTNSNDTEGGTGVNKVKVTGLDTEYNIVTEIASLNGTTPVHLSEEFYRINHLEAYTVGNSHCSQGTITLGTGPFSSGLAATQYGVINKFCTMDLTAVYTVPGSHCLLIYPPSIGFDSTRAKAIVRPVVKYENGSNAAFIPVQTMISIPAATGNNMLASLLPEKTELQVWVSSTDATPDITVEGESLLIQGCFFDELHQR